MRSGRSSRAVYERLIDRYAGLGDRDRAWEVCRKLGTLRRDRLLDGPGALEALRGAVELRPDDAESRAALAELYAAKGDRTAAVRELEIVARTRRFARRRTAGSSISISARSVPIARGSRRRASRSSARATSRTSS